MYVEPHPFHVRWNHTLMSCHHILTVCWGGGRGGFFSVVSSFRSCGFRVPVVWSCVPQPPVLWNATYAMRTLFLLLWCCGDGLISCDQVVWSCVCWLHVLWTGFFFFHLHHVDFDFLNCHLVGLPFCVDLDSLVMWSWTPLTCRHGLPYLSYGVGLPCHMELVSLVMCTWTPLYGVGLPCHVHLDSLVIWSWSPLSCALGLPCHVELHSCASCLTDLCSSL